MWDQFSIISQREPHKATCAQKQFGTQKEHIKVFTEFCQLDLFIFWLPRRAEDQAENTTLTYHCIKIGQRKDGETFIWSVVHICQTLAPAKY